MPKNTILFTLNHDAVQTILITFLQYKKYFVQDEFHYFLDLNKYEYNMDYFLATFTKKHRKNLRYDLVQLKKKIIQENISTKLVGFEEFIKYNKTRFGKDSDFVDSIFVKSIKKLLLNLENKNMLRVIYYTEKQKIVGVEFAAIYNKTHYILNGGYDPVFKNIGKALIMEHLISAAKLKMNRVDLLCNEQGSWKELWKFSKEPYYTFRKTGKKYCSHKINYLIEKREV